MIKLIPYYFNSFALFMLLPIFLLSVPDLSGQEKGTKGRKTARQVENLELKNPEGKDFWLTFMRNHNNPAPGEKNNLNLELFITSDFDAKVVVEIIGLGFREEISLPSGTVRNIKIPADAQIVTSEKVESQMAVHIKSDRPIMVYGLNRRKQTTDTFLGLPKEVLGTDYRAMCYTVSAGLMAQFSIVATEDDTEVTILPSTTTTNGRPAGRPFKVTLQKGDVYQVSAKDSKNARQTDDLTGTYVSANKKISFFSGHQCAYVPTGIIACNHLVEQLPPVSSWGRNFYLGVLEGRSKSSYRVLADQDGTKIFENSQLITNLKAGQHYEKIHSEPLQITSNKPILVSQYSQGYQNGDAIGDPMMLLISPTQQFLKKYRFATPVNGFWEHYINIVVPTDAISSVRLDGGRVPPSSFQKIGISRYSIAYLLVNFGTHEISADKKFGLISYGFGYDKDQFDAYGNISGQSFVEYSVVPDKSPPEIELGADGKSLIIRDDKNNDLGIAAARVLESDNISIEIPQINQGVPQLVIDNINLSEKVISKALLELEDVSGNKAIYTLCYSYSTSTSRYGYSLLEGDEDCESTMGIEITAVIGYSFGLGLNQAIAFDNGNSYPTTGVSESIGGTFGFKVARNVYDNINIGARLQYLPTGASLWGVNVDSTEGFYFDESTGKLEPVNVRAEISFPETFAFGLTADYRLGGFFDIGLEAGILTSLSDEPLAVERIVSPPNGSFIDTGKESRDPFAGNDEAYSAIIPYLGLNLATETKLYSQWYIVPEFRYLLPLTSGIEDINWNPMMLQAGLGIRYKM